MRDNDLIPKERYSA